jgi:hypothetical protein
MHPSQQLKSNDMNYHNNIHQNYNKSDYPQEGQELSVDRLKSCIADLKKLATSKVKKTSAALGGAASNSNQNS